MAAINDSLRYRMLSFGLVFEEHMPECTPLYEMAIACFSISIYFISHRLYSCFRKSCGSTGKWKNQNAFQSVHHTCSFCVIMFPVILFPLFFPLKIIKSQSEFGREILKQ